MYTLKLGQKKLGPEFAFAMGSFLFIILVTHFVTVRQGIESYWFYIVSLYNLFMYVNIAFSNPGWLDAY